MAVQIVSWKFTAHLEIQKSVIVAIFTVHNPPNILNNCAQIVCLRQFTVLLFNIYIICLQTQFNIMLLAIFSILQNVCILYIRQNVVGL